MRRGVLRNCILAIESSCDDTALVILNSKNRIIYERNCSQKNIHQPFGGIVPQLAAQGHRASFKEFIDDSFFKKIMKTRCVKFIAVTNGPGIGSCLNIGHEFASFLSRSLNTPIISINHLQAHLQSVSRFKVPKYPNLTLLVSGGNSQIVFSKCFGMYTVLGETMDDAVGEAIDKTARLLSCNWESSGSFGRSLEILASRGVARDIDVKYLFSDKSPTSLSFSGLKTAIKTYVVKNAEKYSTFDLAATAQKTIFDHLLSRVRSCFQVLKNSNTQIKQFSVVGGVASNTYLQENLESICANDGIVFSVPNQKLCTDNAVMVGILANEILKKRKEFYKQNNTRTNPNWTLEELGIMRVQLN